MASFADRLVALRHDIAVQTVDTPSRAAALAAIDTAVAALQAAVVEERAAAEALAKAPLATLSEKEAVAWVELARAKDAAAKAEAAAEAIAAEALKQ